jgi:hypothetical protein
MPNARGEWTAADYRRDAAEQQEEANAAMRAELMDDRDAYLDKEEF